MCRETRKNLKNNDILKHVFVDKPDITQHMNRIFEFIVYSDQGSDEIFKKLDVNGDSKLTWAECEAVLGKLGDVLAAVYGEVFGM